MFNFSANHLLLLSRMEYRACAVLLMRDDSTRRVYRLHDFTKSHAPALGQYYCVSGKVNLVEQDAIVEPQQLRSNLLPKFPPEALIAYSL